MIELERLRRNAPDLDISEETRHLIESERRAAVNELAAGLAHEINNPLTAILGNTQLLLEKLARSEENATLMVAELNSINLAAQRIARIVQEFMQLPNVEHSRRELIDLRTVVRQAAASFVLRDAAQEIALALILPETPQWVLGNAPLLVQVVTNLLANSLEAMPHGGTIEVEVCSIPPGAVRCAIRDSGFGIGVADLARAFEPGFTTKIEAGVVRGIGLGLYSAERIINSHDGSIRLESRPGQGTTVSFTLPRARHENG